jgi:hypothetical protein
MDTSPTDKQFDTVIDAEALATGINPHLQFPDFRGNAFILRPADKSFEWKTDEVTRYSARRLARTTAEDIW